jgi:hypothetical protein
VSITISSINCPFLQKFLDDPHNLDNVYYMLVDRALAEPIRYNCVPTAVANSQNMPVAAQSSYCDMIHVGRLHFMDRFRSQAMT